MRKILLLFVCILGFLAFTGAQEDLRGDSYCNIYFIPNKYAWQDPGAKIVRPPDGDVTEYADYVSSSRRSSRNRSLSDERINNDVGIIEYEGSACYNVVI